jgi:RHS repeat-associated protein
LHHFTSIFLTLLFFLTGGDFAEAINQVSSAPLGDLCNLAVDQEFLTTDCTESTDKSGLDRQCAKNAKVFKTSLKPVLRDSFSLHSFLTSASLGDLCALAVNSSSSRITPDGKTIDLTYTPDGHLLSKFISQSGLTQGIRTYLTDTNNPTGYAQVIEEKDPLEAAGSQLKKVNLYGHDLISTESRSVGVSPTSSIYYSYDGLGSVRSISNSTGQLTETYDYDAYGTLIGLAKRNPVSGQLESADLTSPINKPISEFLFTGEQYDSDLNMYFLRARYLNTNTGRFHSQDSYEGRNGEPLTLHKYLYANGNPALFTDPSGKMSLGEVTTVIGNLVRSTITSIGAFSSSSAIAISGAILRAGLVPISALSIFTQRVGLPLINRIVNVFANRPDVIPSINRWTNGIIGARAHFFNEALKNSERFSTIANRLGIQGFRWGANGFKFFTEIADEIAELPLGQSVYGTVFRISNGGQSITFIRTSGTGPLVGSDLGVAVVKTGNLIASFRDAVGQVILGGGGL